MINLYTDLQQLKTFQKAKLEGGKNLVVSDTERIWNFYLCMKPDFSSAEWIPFFLWLLLLINQVFSSGQIT